MENQEKQWDKFKEKMFMPNENANISYYILYIPENDEITELIWIIWTT